MPAARWMLGSNREAASGPLLSRQYRASWQPARAACRPASALCGCVHLPFAGIEARSGWPAWAGCVRQTGVAFPC